ncbi:MAG: PepSY domain-containing protein [Magnetospirillum gryphiswaldense]|nr:PepSY domain-containing protein [Magnetospirillum gryphiswaldense]
MRRILALAAALMLAPALTHADEADHDRARRALEEGRILPLRDILNRAEAEVPGQMIEAELEDEHGQLVYEIKVLGKDGRVVKLIYDAGSGQLLKKRQKDGK